LFLDWRLEDLTRACAIYSVDLGIDRGVSAGSFVEVRRCWRA